VAFSCGIGYHVGTAGEAYFANPRAAGRPADEAELSPNLDDDLLADEKLSSTGPKPVTDRDVVTAGAGGIYSTPIDMTRYLAALLGGGANEHGTVLKPATLAAMFAAQFQPDPRISGMGPFWRRTARGHPVVEHQGITGPAARCSGCRLRCRDCSTICWASLTTSSAPASRNDPRSGVTSAVGITSRPAH
jgi:CubicO group peptidase (beta-lactamase class C family)